jgi:uncharacterized protein
MLEKVIKINLLYDFYGQMLTDKQKEIIELYYYNDLSLGEISESWNISRQGVYDILKRSENLLYYYEDKLCLVEKFTIQNKKLKEAYSLLENVEVSETIDKVKSIIRDIMEIDI